MLVVEKATLEEASVYSDAIDQLESAPRDAIYPSGRTVPSSVGRVARVGHLCRRTDDTERVGYMAEDAVIQSHDGQMVTVDGEDVTIDAGDAVADDDWRPHTYFELPEIVGPRSELLPEGEEPESGGRFFDWHRAGTTIPSIATQVELDPGATGAEIQSAIDSVTAPGAVLLREGDYPDIVQRIALRSGVVLRGEGPGTVLHFPQPLEELYPDGRPESFGSYSYGGGFITMYGDTIYKGRVDQHVAPTKLADVTATASRGDTQLSVSTTSGLSVGDWVRLMQIDPGDGALMDELHVGLMNSGEDTWGDRGCDFPAQIESIGSGTVTLDRPLPMTVDPSWSAAIHEVGDLCVEAGVEDLTIDFAWKEYAGHHNAEGYNGISIEDAWKCWVRGVTIWNCDFGADVKRSFFCTLDTVITDADPARSGHHGIMLSWGGDNLVRDCEIRDPLIHDLSVEWYERASVFSRCSGTNLNMDCHRAAPYATLWTEMDFGAGTRPWRSSGNTIRGPNTAAYCTLWGGRADREVEVPGITNFGPRMTIVGTLPKGLIDEGPDWHVEFIDPDDLDPPNLHEAML